MSIFQKRQTENFHVKNIYLLKCIKVILKIRQVTDYENIEIVKAIS